MKNEHADLGIEQVLDFIRNGGMKSYEDHLEFLKALANGFVERDKRLLFNNDYEQELVTFQTISATPDSAPKLFVSMQKFVFTLWVHQSPNRFAVAYRLGRSDGAKQLRDRNVRRAAQGRRLIGATSRQKVANASEGFRHLSKGNAAYAIADKVNLDPGTIKRYLSELFPGEKWKQ